MRPALVPALLLTALLTLGAEAAGQWRIARVWDANTARSLAVSPQITSRSSASIEPPGVLNLRSGCNSMSASGLKPDGTARLEEPAMTRMACPADLAALEAALLAALRLVRSHERSGNEMILRDADGKEVLALIR
jgi:heat shock protein HslJ